LKKPYSYIIGVALLILLLCAINIFVLPKQGNHSGGNLEHKNLVEEDSSNSGLESEQDATLDYDPNEWMELTSEDGFTLDIRYATENNFTDKVIYSCGRCFLRPEMAEKLIVLNSKIEKDKGWHFKLFDCYRPRPAQQKLWDIVPNPIYVTPPDKGSMHNRGLAVDLTFVDENNKQVDMGTIFDFFGPPAHHDNQDHPQQVIEDRVYLKKLMEDNGFNSITSEWWHYSMNGTGYGFSDWEWNCE